MQVAILGSARVPFALAREAVDRADRALMGPADGDMAIGTFLRGGVHRYAEDLAASRRWPCFRFHSCAKLIQWKPDLAFIFWDGKSKGCPAVLEQLTRANILCFSFLLREGKDPLILGSNRDHILIAA